MKTLFEVLLLFVLLYVALDVASSKSLPPGELVEFEYSQEKARGRYESRDGVSGITFLSKVDDHSLLVSTLQGKILINTSVDEQQGFRMVHTLDHKYRQFPGISRPDESVDHDHLFNHSIEKLLEVNEITLLSEAA